MPAGSPIEIASRVAVTGAFSPLSGPEAILGRVTRPLPVGTLLACLIVAVVGAGVLVEFEVVELTFRGTETSLAAAAGLRARRVPLVLGLTPLLALLLACFCPGVVDALRTWPARRVAGLAAGLAAWMLIFTARGFLTAEGFDAYAPTILAAAAFAAVLSARNEVAGRLSAAGLVVWLLIWIPFDLRWYQTDLWLGGQLSVEYNAFSLLVSLTGILGFAVVARLDVVGVRPPRLSDLKPALILLAVLAATLIPLGLALGFLNVEVPDELTPLAAVLIFAGLAITVALPEELFFRGILDAGLRKHLSPGASLAVSSFAFGLMHWNNAGSLGERVVYVFLATLAGAVYAGAFRKTGGLFAAVLVHTLVDLLWKAALGG
jgi:membrane protease YdiL (CAAX protease family)